MNAIMTSLLAPRIALLATSGPWAGKSAFILVFVIKQQKGVAILCQG